MEGNQLIRRIMKRNRKTQQDLAEHLGISKRTLETKLYRGGFDTNELMQVADCLGFKLAFVNDEQQVIFDVSGEVIQNVDSTKKRLDRKLPNHKQAIRNFIDGIHAVTDEPLDEEFDEIVSDRINITRELDLWFMR